MDPAAALDVKNLSRMRAVHEAEKKGDSEIQQMFNGSVVFITGGTGFLGKQLVEKLLRACHGIRKIYLLTRSKKGKTVEERLEKTFNDPVFDQLRKLNPEFNKSIDLIEGDINELNLGIKHEDWIKLTKEVNFIYHVAATVLFNEPLKSAITANVRGTREAITLARECHNLKSMVHVSTAYSHCNRKELSEKFYPSPVPPETIIEMVENMEESRLDALTPALIESWPNTYTFSKAIAEETVRVMGEGLPICVVRPAIVIPSHREPIPGWLEISNVFGPSGLVLGGGIGFIHTVLANEETLMDLVPVDYVNNLIIASSWETAERFQRGEQDIKIYTCSRVRNTISWDELRKLGEAEAMNYMSPKTIWHPWGHTTTNRAYYLLMTIIFHFIPALLLDCILMAIGQKLRVRKIYEKAYKLNTVLSYFLLNTWKFYDNNTLALTNKLTHTDKLIFHFDVADIDDRSSVLVWWLGIRKFIIKDGLRGTENTLKIRYPIMRIVHYIVSALYIFFLWKVLSWSFTVVSFCFASLVQFTR